MPKRDRQGNVITLIEWSDLRDDMTYRTVAKDQLHGHIVHTVWEGIDDTELFFTGVRLEGSGSFVTVASAGTEQQAEMDHRKVVDLVRHDPGDGLVNRLQRECGYHGTPVPRPHLVGTLADFDARTVWDLVSGQVGGDPEHEFDHDGVSDLFLRVFNSLKRYGTQLELSAAGKFFASAPMTKDEIAAEIERVWMLEIGGEYGDEPNDAFAVSRWPRRKDPEALQATTEGAG